jgi:hypothetical protein
MEYLIPQTMFAQLSVANAVLPKPGVPDFQLSWSHYQILLRISDKNVTSFQ